MFSRLVTGKHMLEAQSGREVSKRTSSKTASTSSIGEPVCGAVSAGPRSISSSSSPMKSSSSSACSVSTRTGRRAGDLGSDDALRARGRGERGEPPGPPCAWSRSSSSAMMISAVNRRQRSSKASY
jgi:hypothetical protein